MSKFKAGDVVRMVGMYQPRNTAFLSGELSIGSKYVIEDVEELVTEDVFLNEEKLPFDKLTKEQRSVIVEACIKGKVERSILSKEWSKYTENSLFMKHVYRTIVEKVVDIPTPLHLPWDWIRKQYKWAAMDKDGVVVVFEEEPCLDKDGYWGTTKLGIVMASYPMGVEIGTSGVNYKTSLTKRPE